jgi:asparaginyl-tRNA synthetase
MSTEATHRVSYSTEDYSVFQLNLLLSHLEIGERVATEFNESLDTQTKGMLLTTPSSSIGTRSAVFRELISLSSHASMTGKSAEETAQIDQWVDFAWHRLEVPLQLIFSVLGKTEEIEVFERAKADFVAAVAELDAHLDVRTFIVGESITLADLVLYGILFTAQELQLMDKAAVNASRWFRTVSASPFTQSVVRNKDLVKLIPSSVVSAASAASERQFAGKWDRHRIRVKELLAKGQAMFGQNVTIKGWIRTSRSADKGSILFVELTDGSTVKPVQLVLSSEKTTGFNDIANCGGAGASLAALGKIVPSPAKGQLLEVHVDEVKLLGAVYGGDNGEIGGKNYPMAKKQHTLEFLREKAHLRPRSKVFSAAMRMRHAMAFATHKFFNERGFVYVHTPLITGADCEGAGEQFVVTTLLGEDATAKSLPTKPDGKIDYSKDFFSKRCCLTVSGQLNVETHACALSDVYTFGPTFRAENSHTARHLAEFWMIEPEICFADLVDDMALAEDYVRYCAAYALEHCADDLHYFENEYPNGEKGLAARLRNVVESDFARITYTEAVRLLQEEVRAGKVKFEAFPQWGDDLGSEHERYITEQVNKKPTIVINYPKGIKAFYMKLNDDNQTVAAMDLLVPKIGELIGGSQREDNLQTLEQRCRDSGLKPEDLWWYNDLRRYGSVPHAGFGLGFERLIMFVTGLENIRDVIPFPRVPGHAEF